jgi:hypothetical protein
MSIFSTWFAESILLKDFSLITLNRYALVLSFVDNGEFSAIIASTIDVSNLRFITDSLDTFEVLLIWKFVVSTSFTGSIN